MEYALKIYTECNGRSATFNSLAMAMKTKHAGLIVTLLTPFILAVMTYIIESFMIPDDKPHPLGQMSYYFIYHLILRLPLFIILFWIYVAIFKRATIVYRSWGAVYAVAAAYLSATYIFSNDARLDLSVDEHVLMPINYCVTAIILWALYESLRIYKFEKQ